MMEMEVVVKLGSARMKVPFTGGSMTAMGVNPAKFITDNLLTQKAIENSVQYKKGLIKRIHVVNLAEEVRILKNSEETKDGPADLGTPSGQKPREGAPEETEETKEADPDTPSGQKPREETQEGENSGEAEILEEAEETETSEEAEEEISEEGLTQGNEGSRVYVEFSLSDDAKDYLEANYGANKTKLKTRAEIIAFAKEQGVDLVFV